jgi:pilus assembly protein Flp/PilA
MDVQRLVRTEDGASAVEYGLLVAGIAALVVAVVFAFGGVIGNLFSTSCGTIGGHITGATCGP